MLQRPSRRRRELAGDRRRGALELSQAELADRPPPARPAADEVLDDLLVRFGAVSEENRLGKLTYADWANRRRPFEALQLILPDPHGNWLWEIHYHGLSQPLLD